MKLDFRDYEAMAALEHGTLEDWAFESSMHFADVDNKLIEGQCYGEAQEAIAKAKFNSH